MTEKVSFSGLDQQGGQPAGDNANPVSAQQNTPGVAVPQGDQAKDTGLSAAEIRSIMAEEVSKALEMANRKAQSMNAKTENRIKQLVTDQIALLQNAGMAVNDQQKQAIETAIRKQEAPQADATQPEGED